jgi:dTDP-4-amino-4,6-dideoxygalactose transaminase
MNDRPAATPVPARVTPARSRPDTERVMRLGSALTGAAEEQAVTGVLRSQIFYRYHGSAVAAFEREFSAGVVAGQRTLAVNSGSSALQVAFAALDEEPGFEVLVPVLGFVSAATSVASAGGVPRFVPVDATLGIDAAAAARFVTPRTRAVLAVHAYGAACDLAAVRRLAGRHGLAVVEDVAQACGASFRGAPLGTHGTVAAFSFQHFKLLSTGEGGMVTSADGAVMDRAQCLHDAASYWVARDTADRVGRLRMPPANLRMSELEGALGAAQLARLPGWIARLRETKQVLAGHLAGVAGVTPRPLPDAAGEIATTLVFACPGPGEAAQAIAGLRAEGVNAGPLLGPAGANRHFAGDWTHVLAQCGLPGPEPEVVSAARDLLGPCVVIALDLRWDERDLAETLLALERVMPR